MVKFLKKHGLCAIRYAASYYNAEQLKESIPWYKKGLEILKQASKDETFELALAYEKVGRTYVFDENPDYEKAEVMFDKAIEIRKRLIERFEKGEVVRSIDEYKDFSIERAQVGTLLTIMEKGRLYQAKGDYEKAYEYAKEYTEQYGKHLLMNESNLAYGYYDSGVCLLEISKKLEKHSTQKIEMLNEAEIMLKKVQEINSKKRGEVAWDTLQNEEVLGDVYKEKGQYADASNSYLAVLNMLEKHFSYKVDYIYKIKEKMNFKS